jgi:hypothetical protein
MKIPRLFRKLTPIFGIACGVFLLAASIFGIAEWKTLAAVSGTLMGISFVLTFVFLIGSIVIRNLENALLRRFGEPATATVLAVADVNERDNYVYVYRVKLEVHPSGGEPFVAVAEDAIRFSNYLSTGDTVSVKYDPPTKEVALVMPKKIKVKKEDF